MLSNYALSLDSSVKDRYIKKISAIGCDPFYQIKFHLNSETSSFRTFNNSGDAPQLNEQNITEYFIHGISSYTGKPHQATKSLEAKNFLVSGKIQIAKWKRINKEIFLVIAEVGHSLRTTEAPLHLWLLIDSSGNIRTGHCTCAAGCAESCSHLAAVCYLISNQETITVTSVVAYWKQPSKSSAPKRPIEVSDASLGTVFNKMKERLNLVAKNETNFKMEKLPPKVDMPSFLKESFHCSGSALYRVVSPWSYKLHEERKEIKPSELNSLFNPQHQNCDLEILVKLGHSLRDKLVLSNEEIKQMENDTQSQNECLKWYKFRAGRITASCAKEVCCIRRPDSNITLIKKICYVRKNSIKTDATTWGLVHENDGVEEYKKIQETKHLLLKIERCGFFVCQDHQFLGGSPDRIVTCLCCEERGIIEVKCPYTLVKPNTSVSDLPYLDEYDKLSTKSAYYYQIQTQLRVSNSYYCDFVIWWPKGIKIERITRNDNIISEIVEKSRIFYNEVIIPELLGKYFTRKAEEKKKKILKDTTNTQVPPVAELKKIGKIRMKALKENKENEAPSK